MDVIDQGLPAWFSSSRAARCARLLSLLLVFFLCGLIALGYYGGYVELLAQAPQAGRNVNMVSGREWPGGDPFLQRQDEPSIAFSTRNPQHLLAGANDYRTVDLPGLPDGRVTGDAWHGAFTSMDGGNTWQSTLLPGYPQDTSPEGLLSPLKGYQAGSDPTVRASTNGLFYYSGIVFNREEEERNVLFVARFIDNNNKEAGNSIQYIDTNVVNKRKKKHFVADPHTVGDLRPVPAEFVADPINPSPLVWHTVDVRVAQADPANTPVFVSAPVSKYLYLLGSSGKPWQVQASSVNYPMFAQGTLPFMGDYIDIAAPAMIQDLGGRWKFNTEPLRSPVFQSVWTDNRDVIPPPKPQNWTKYSPPGALGGTQSKFDPTKTVDACVPGVAGMRNQNIYTARITQGLVVASPGNAKPTGKIQRAFVVYVENATNTPRSYRLTIAAQPPGGGDNPFGGTLNLNCVVDRDGPHTILITDRNFNEVGAYQMSLSRAP